MLGDFCCSLADFALGYFFRVRDRTQSLVAIREPRLVHASKLESYLQIKNPANGSWRMFQILSTNRTQERV